MLKTGLIDSADFICSPNCDERENHVVPEAIIVHCISLPPGEYGGGAVSRLFQNQLSADEHPYYERLA
ncbi:MAG: hypothetical protein JKX81_04660, partial [Arenicella sp.]|nr:hypothetical protein [Arenicella sp.]